MLAALFAISFLIGVEGALFHKDFSSTRGWRTLGYSRHNAVNKTLELISEGPLAGKKHRVCSIWTKQKIYWHEGFELKFVFRMRTPDASNNGGEGFAIVFQQDRPLAVGDLRSKGERPPIDGKTYFPEGLGFNELTKSWAIKFDMDPQTTDASRKPHISIHSGGDWINPFPSRAFTDELPQEPSGGVLRIYWASDHFSPEHGTSKYTWGTWSRPILQVPISMPHLDERPAWFGFTSATGFNKVQTVDIVALTYHEIRHNVNGNNAKCIVCGGKSPRCCLHWEQMKEEKDDNRPNSFVNEYMGQDYPALNKNPRIWDKEEWY
jgi:hypothetical protein